MAEEESELSSEDALEPIVNHLRLSMVKDKDLLQYEIVRKKLTNPKKYEQLANQLGFQDIKSMTQLAVKQDNLNALMGLAKSNVYAVTAELGRNPEYSNYFVDKYQKNQGNQFIPEFYFMIRTHAPKPLKILLQRLTRAIILKTSLNISGRGFRGKTRHRVPYSPGMAEMDVEGTLFNYLQHGQHLSYWNIVGIQRRQKKRNVVLILDTSGSMFGQMLMNAALTTSVLSYAMARDFTSVILFSQEAYVLKGLKDRKAVVKLIDQILESEAVGFTNISKALKRAHTELEKSHAKNSKNSFAILITDGDYNRGGDPVKLAPLFPHLHVIGMPSQESKEKQKRGQQICMRLAAVGRGYYIPVTDINEIPRTLMELLSKL